MLNRERKRFGGVEELYVRTSCLGKNGQQRLIGNRIVE